MPTSFQTFCAFFAVAFTLTAPIQAAPDQRGTIEAEIRVAATGIAGSNSTVWMRGVPGGAPVRLDLNVRTFSEPLKYKGYPKAQFYASEAAARGTIPNEDPLASLVIHEGSSLLVFVPRDNGYQVYSIAASDFPFGSFRFANLTNAAVRAEMGSEGATMKPGESHTFSYSKDQAALRVKLFSQTAEKGVRFIRQSNWSLSLAQRELILFYTNPISGLIQTEHFVDSALPPPEEVAASVP